MIEELGIKVVVKNTIMNTMNDKIQLAKVALNLLGLKTEGVP